jgi:serine protease Do
VKRFIQLLSKFGKPVGAWIGVYVAPLTQEIARSMGIEAKRGVIVVRVVPGSPAHEQGIQSGDIITRAGENEISKPLDLRKAIEDNIDKGEIELEIIRRGRIARLAVPIYIEEL